MTNYLEHLEDISVKFTEISGNDNPIQEITVRSRIFKKILIDLNQHPDIGNQITVYLLTGPVIINKGL